MPLVVAALPALIVAIVGMILLWGLALLLKSVLQSLANHVPVVGGPLSNTIGAIIDQAITIGASAARAVIGEAVGLLLAPVYWVERHITSAINFFTGIISAIGYITRTLIPDEVAALDADILATYHAAITYTQSVAHLLYAAIAYDVAELEHEITSAEAAVTRYAQQLVAAAEAYTTAAIAAETRFVLAEVGALETQIERVAAAESAYAETLYADATGYARTLVAAAESTLATDIAGVQAWTGAQVTALDAAIAAMGTQVIAFTLDAVGTVESDLTHLKDDCLDNLCKGLGPLASLFNSLVDAAAIAALIGYAGWMASEPRAAGHATADVLGPIATGVAAGARDLLSAL